MARVQKKHDGSTRWWNACNHIHPRHTNTISSKNIWYIYKIGGIFVYRFLWLLIEGGLIWESDGFQIIFSQSRECKSVSWSRNKSISQYKNKNLSTMIADLHFCRCQILVAPANIFPIHILVWADIKNHIVTTKIKIKHPRKTIPRWDHGVKYDTDLL